MARRRWWVRRDTVATLDGHRRWDRAYQSLLTWTAASPATRAGRDASVTQEAGHERGRVRAGLDVATGAGADD